MRASEHFLPQRKTVILVPSFFIKAHAKKQSSLSAPWKLGTQATMRRSAITNFIRIASRLFLGFLVTGIFGCSSLNPSSNVKIKEGLSLFDSLIPVPPDSIIGLYGRFNSQTFHSAYKDELRLAQRFIDSMNTSLDAPSRIDTLAVDHSIENFGNAARAQHTIFISSSYFFLFNDPSVVRSVLTHEFGHIYFDKLPSERQTLLEQIWRSLQERALFYIFRDGEYSGNAKFGGHPDESPAELFASAFNLFHNRPEELKTRLQYVPTEHYGLIEQLRQLVLSAKGKAS